MSTRDYFKMQSINFCYMSFMLQATNQKKRVYKRHLHPEYNDG